MNTPLETPMVGPRGGDTNDPRTHPDWRRSEFKGSPIELHRFEEEDTTAPGRKNEQPWHRMAAYMLLAGRTNSEIALAANVQVNTISHLRGQKWFQDLLAVLANSEGDEVLGLIKAESVASVEKLVSLRDKADSENVQFSAAKSLLEHACGKPVQMNLNTASRPSNLSPQEEMDTLKAELQALRNRNTSPCQS